MWRSHGEVEPQNMGRLRLPAGDRLGIIGDNTSTKGEVIGEEMASVREEARSGYGLPLVSLEALMG